MLDRENTLEEDYDLRDLKTSLGVVVVNCLGNNGERVYDKMLAPADGDSVLGIGAVDSAGVVGEYPWMRIDGQWPSISYHDATNGELALRK